MGGENEDGNTKLFSQLDYGITSRLNLGLKFFKISKKSLNSEDIFFGPSISYYMNNWNFQFSNVQSNKNLGSLNEIIVWTELLGVRTKISTANFTNLQSDWVTKNYASIPSQEYKIELNHAFSFFPLRLNFEHENIDFETRSSIEKSKLSLGTYVAGWNFNIAQNILTDAVRSESTEVGASLNKTKHSYRLSSSLKKNELQRLETSYRYKAGRNSSYRIQLSREQTSLLDSLQLSYMNRFKFFNWSIDGFMDSNNDYSLGSFISYTLGGSGFYLPHLSGKSQSTLSYLRVNVFLDENGNKVKDLNEERLANVAVSVDRGKEKYFTDDEGFVIIDGLPAHTPLHLTVDELSLPEAYYYSPKDVNVELGRGKIYDFDIAIRGLGEIDGFVIPLVGIESTRSVRRIPILLMSEDNKEVKRVLTDSDGYFVFEKLDPGGYEISIDPKYIKKTRKKFKPLFTKRRIQSKGGYVDEVNFNRF